MCKSLNNLQKNKKEEEGIMKRKENDFVNYLIILE